MFNDDAKLVRHILNGDSASFRTLYNRHAPRVFRLLVRLSQDRTQAEDTTQEVFLTAYRSLSTWQARGEFSSWLCGIAVRLHRKHCSHTAHLLLEPLDDEYPDTALENDPFDALTQQEAERAIEKVIEELPLAYREAFVLIKIEGMKQKEAAELLEIPIGTVQSRLWRAVCLLRKRLQEQDIVSPQSISLKEEGAKQDAVQFRA